MKCEGLNFLGSYWPYQPQLSGWHQRRVSDHWTNPRSSDLGFKRFPQKRGARLPWPGRIPAAARELSFLNSTGYSVSGARSSTWAVSGSVPNGYGIFRNPLFGWKKRATKPQFGPGVIAIAAKH